MNTLSRQIRRVLALAALAGVTFARPAAAQNYVITDLGLLSGYTGTQAQSLNNAGHVTGTLTNNGTIGHAFFYDGSLHDIGTLGGSASIGYGINNTDVITGYALLSNGMNHAFYYDGTMHDIGTLGGNTSIGYDINGNGQITGASQNMAGQGRAFLYSGGPSGTTTDLGTLGGSNSAGYAINSNGQVAGAATLAGDSVTHAFFYDTTMHDLGTLGGTNSVGYSLNSSGLIVGQSDTATTGQPHAFLYTGGAMTDLGTLGGSTSAAYAINSNGLITGTADIANNASRHAFVYRNGAMRDLNGLVISGTGWSFQKGNSINDRGQIVGVGFLNGVGPRSFLLTPNPPRFDFNNDLHNDILWQNQQSGQALVWDMNDTQVVSYGAPFTTVADTNWKIVAIADMNGDGHPDLLWQNQRTGQVLRWLMGGTNGTTVSDYGAPFITVSDLNWKIVSMTDFDNDGQPDILWQNQATGDVLVWYMMDDHTVKTYGAPFVRVSDTNWKIVGTGDFNVDGHPDIVWQNQRTGQVLRWLMGGTNGTTVSQYGPVFAAITDTNWKIVGVGEERGSGYPDLLWYNQRTGQVLRWAMQDTTVRQYGSVFVTVRDLTWKIAGIH